MSVSASKIGQLHVSAKRRIDKKVFAMHALDEPLSPECWSPRNVGAQGLYWDRYVQRKLKLSVSIAVELGPMPSCLSNLVLAVLKPKGPF
jgi:hypothetical protein